MKLGLALPKWLVDKDNNVLVLFIYALAFGIGLPFMVVILSSLNNILDSLNSLCHSRPGGGTLLRKSITLKY